ncbi:hypothetical protein M427DRAFT_29700 [Gonapodya prolifera JEL478]|uniref:Pali-domain-containing protein n=1 Tax=Gonapodya prolifera (strain JEL478) TaxID=1344416 RepID=A0A139APC5_GONPJ|nr:hypothetical protein M427DRAFT_29700 [Gonapodya prolifera JEL478]|eukprot:KXS18363.1 hypothetical protein M427DRAFT_29700 [Gonapodya prolifera JEL478]
MPRYIDLSTLATLFAVSSCITLGLTSIGGGVAVVPFKSLPWIQAHTFTMGLFGACPSQPGYATLWTYNPNWADVQSKCVTIFDHAQLNVDGEATDTITFPFRISLLGTHELALVLCILALILGSAGRPRTAEFFAYIAFISNAVGFALAVWQFNMLITSYNNDGRGYTANFGAGMYLSAASLLLEFLVADLYAVHARRLRAKSPSEEFLLPRGGVEYGFA